MRAVSAIRSGRLLFTTFFWLPLAWWWRDAAACRYDYAYARTDSGSDSHSVARLPSTAPVRLRGPLAAVICRLHGQNPATSDWGSGSNNFPLTISSPLREPA